MKRFSWREFGILALLAVLAAALIGGALYANHRLLARVGVGEEFLLPWLATRAFLFDRTEPYSSSVPASVQEQVYGRAARPGEDPFVLDVPFHLLLPSFVFGLFRDPALAGAIWLLILEGAMLALVWASLQLAGWQPRRGFLIGFYLFASLNLYTMLGLLEGSAVFLLGLMYAGVLLALAEGMDELAGALIAFSAFQWQVGLPLLGLIWLKVFTEQRWRVLAGFAMVTSLLVVISWFVYPDWLIPFLRAVTTDLRADYGVSIRTTLNGLLPGLDARVGRALPALLVVVLLIEWARARRAEQRQFYWTACLTLAATPLLGFRTELENLAVLILPLALIFSVLRERWKAGYWLTSLVLILILLVPWALLIGAGFTLPQLGSLLLLFLPLTTLVGLYWTRWWAVRPPRTWLDRAIDAEYR